MPTLADIAARTGVSKNTVSLVLRGCPLLRPVRQSTIDSIHRVAKELNYVPNRVPQALRSHKSNMIGLIVRGFCNPLFAHINQALITELGQRGLEVLVTDVPDLQEQRRVKDLYGYRVDGMIVGPIYRDEISPFLMHLIDQRYPLVFFQAHRAIAADHIVMDNSPAVVAAVGHLLALGHRRIGCYVSIPEHIHLKAYRQAMAEAGLAVRPEWVTIRPGHAEEGYAFGQAAAFGPNDPTAHLFHDDFAALGFMRALADRGIRVPQDVAVIGSGDYPYSSLNLVRLTTIRMPTDQIVRHAIEFLTKRLANRSLPGWQSVTLHGELVIRESSQSR